MLKLIGQIISFVIWLFKRKATHDDKPSVQYEKSKDEIAKAVTESDADTVNLMLERDLDSLPDKGGSDSK